MKKILILYPHFPPSNLAGVHRPRLFANHLKSYGWEPVILTVHEKFYEEAPDWNLVKLLPADLRIEKVAAFRLTKPRVVGDIGLRAFSQLYKKAKQLIRSEGIHFLYIPIPSFYCALLGRRLHNATGISYGIDYIDPWVHEFPGSNKLFSRHWFSTKLAKLLEPIAVKKASLITGVAEGYYQAVLERNPHLKNEAVFGAMPYGGDENDHRKVKELQLKSYLFSKEASVFKFVYAGAMLPKAYNVLEAVFKSIATLNDTDKKIQFHFIGTGKTSDDPEGYNIKPLAVQYNLWQTVVFEYPKRIPYLDVLVHLEQADGIFILGSTEAHYTPSKSYQGVISGKPILALLHKDSTAVEVLRRSGAGMVLDFEGEAGISSIEKEFSEVLKKFLHWASVFDNNKTDKTVFSAYSANAVTGKLAALLDRVVKQ